MLLLCVVIEILTHQTSWQSYIFRSKLHNLTIAISKLYGVWLLKVSDSPLIASEKFTQRRRRRIGSVQCEWGYWLSVAAAGLFIPESVQSPAWILQSSRQPLHSWVSWMIVAQVQLSQMGGVGVQSWDQRSTAFLCDQTAWQPADTQNNTHHTSAEGLKDSGHTCV